MLSSCRSATALLTASTADCQLAFHGYVTLLLLNTSSGLLSHVQVISDLLKPEKVNLMIREDRRRGVFVDGLSEWVVRSPAEVYGLMMRGAQQVRTAQYASRCCGGGDVALRSC
jgi:hypothetical protein